METFNKEATTTTPQVLLNPRGHLSLTGISMSENNTAFFYPIIKWIEGYCLQPQHTTHVDLNIEYLDSSSLAYFNIILQKLNDIHIAGKSHVQVIWQFESDDMDMEDHGADICDMFDFAVQMRPMAESV